MDITYFESVSLRSKVSISSFPPKSYFPSFHVKSEFQLSPVSSAQAAGYRVDLDWTWGGRDPRGLLITGGQTRPDVRPDLT